MRYVVLATMLSWLLLSGCSVTQEQWDRAMTPGGWEMPQRTSITCVHRGGGVSTCY